MPEEDQRDRDEHHHHGRGRGRPVGDHVRDFFTNWSSSQGSLAEKLALTLRNRARAYGPPFRGCCGHPGEPGC